MKCKDKEHNIHLQPNTHLENSEVYSKGMIHYRTKH